MTRSLFTIILFLALTLSAHAQESAMYAQESPKYEVRAVWLTTIGGIDWPRSHQKAQQQEELRKTLDQLKQAGINTVLFQARVRATTIYPSSEPWDACLTGTAGKSPGYDPLQFCIDECHKRGMQLHAWVVTIPIGKWNKAGCTQLRKKYPQMVVRIGEDGFMNPEYPATADYLARCCSEIVERYDVDGIHLDYIRYPEIWPKPSAAKGRKGRKAVKQTVSKSPSERRECITGIVRAIHHAVKARKPWVMLSCSPIGKHDDLTRYRSGGWNARTAVSQDAQQWMKEGLMDALFPMMYFRDNHFFPFAIDWQERSYGRIIVPGLGIYFLDPHEGQWELSDVTRQMNVSRQIGLGHCYFRSKFLLDNVKGIYETVCRFDETPALTPPMTWLTDEVPTPPTGLKTQEGRLCWEAAHDNSQNDDYILYNVYASENYPVDISKAENIVATRLRQTSIGMDKEGKKNYAVTAMNRYGIESRAAQMLVNAGPRYAKPAIVITDGRQIMLPKKPSTLDASYAVIETLAGQQIAVCLYREDHPADVSQLPDGIYQLRALGRKGRNHRIGFFAIKRK